VTRSLLTVSLVAALAVSLSACGSGKHARQPTAGCSSAPRPALPTPVGNPRPGQVRWSVLLDQCAGKARTAWYDMRESELGALGPGDELILDLDGTISRFELSTGARSWQRKVVAPAAASVFDSVEATKDLVMVTLAVKADDKKYAFLDAHTGAPLGAMNQQPDGVPELVGGHVVIRANGTVSGYDPRTGTSSWQVKYTVPPDAWPVSGLAHDDTTLYVQPPGGASNEIMRVDAATGRVLPSLRLPAAARLTHSSIEPSGTGQGVLVLWEHSATPSSAPPGGTGVHPVVRSVGIDTRTGALAWSRPEQIAAADSGPFSTYLGEDGVFTAVDPRTGRTLWTVTENGLGTGNSLYALEPLPDYLVQAVEGGDGSVTDDPGTVGGVPPKGTEGTHPAWHSVALPRPQCVAADQATAVVSTCDPWGNPMRPAGCADRELVAIAL
jgi:outer membrane protein assembly factor BamB